MALAGDAKHAWIQTKHILITVIIIVSTLSFIASVVLITIGYLNPFGAVGLGILGGGCVLYFLTILFLCSTNIWVKNRHYDDENDFKEKSPQSANEDNSPLKPALNVTSTANNEAGCINENDRQSDDNKVPLYSVSTLCSTASSSVSTVPDRTVLLNWKEGDDEGTLDCDVFSSSLTAVQHTDIKVQEKMNLKWGSTEQINSESTSECEIKDLEKRKIADLPILHSKGKSVSDTPRQRKPLVIDFVGTTITEEMQLMNRCISGQSKEENTANTNSQICSRNNDISDMLCPVEGPPSSATQSKHPKHIYLRKATKKNTQESKPALGKRNIQKDNHIPDRRWCVISEGDSWIHNPRVQVPTSKGVKVSPAANSKTKKKNISCEKKPKFSPAITDVTLQNLPPSTDQSEKVQLSNQTTTSEHLSTMDTFKMDP